VTGQNGSGQNGIGQNGIRTKWNGQNGTDKTVAICGIDYNSSEFNTYLVAKVTNKL